MTAKFNREERYVVFKLADLGNSLKGDEIRQLAKEYAEQRRLNGKPPLECVVIESDWPEYGPTWGAIEARMTGSPEESAVQTAARIMNSELIQERDALQAKVEAMESDLRLIAETDPVDAALDPQRAVRIAVHSLYLAPGAQPAPSVPEGWKLMPIEPTPKMMRAAQKADHDHGDHEGWLEYDGEDVKRVYRAMLAAAPEAK